MLTVLRYKALNSLQQPLPLFGQLLLKTDLCFNLEL